MTVLPTELAGDDRPDPERSQLPLAGQFHSEDAVLTERSRRPNPIQRFRNVWEYRELLSNLTKLQLKVKYKNSVLGFLWSLLNPALYLAVFGIVFGVLMKNNVDAFPVYLLSGLLAWNFFSTALAAGAGSVVGSAALVTKVWFPREILPLASVGAAAFHLALQSLVIFLAMGIFQRVPSLPYCLLLIPAIVILLLLSSALAIALAAINVYMRDTQHLLELVLVAWFWASAIVYPFNLFHKELYPHKIPDAVTWLNPIVPIILVFQKALYNPQDTYQKGTHIILKKASDVIPTHGIGWFASGLGVVAVLSVALLFIALWLFGRLEDNFAEEI